MTIFRKNYIPKLNIYQDSKTGKWFAERHDDIIEWSFVKRADGSYDISGIHASTQFDTFEDLMIALYEYDCKAHIEDARKNITYGSIKVKL